MTTLPTMHPGRPSLKNPVRLITRTAKGDVSRCVTFEGTTVEDLMAMAKQAPAMVKLLSDVEDHLAAGGHIQPGSHFAREIRKLLETVDPK